METTMAAMNSAASLHHHPCIIPHPNMLFPIFTTKYSISNLHSHSRSRWTPHSRLFTAAALSGDGGITTVESATEVVRNFYGGINGRDLPYVKTLISLNCVYEDLIFPRPFVGQKEIMEFFENFMEVVDKDLQFVVDKISTQDSSSVGVTWHLEWRGKTFPFSKGCSFYELEIINGKRQIVYGRDSVEPAIKPGKAALAIIRGVTWLLQQFPQLADRF